MVWVSCRDKKINRTDMYKNFIFVKVAFQTIRERTDYVINGCETTT